MIITTTQDFEKKMASYPPQVGPQLRFLRKLIRSVAESIPEINRLEEELKWGEPSFITETGSTLRMDWKEKYPNRYGLYFKCTSRLVPTIRALYGNLFTYERNRALHFRLDGKIPEEEVRSCIRMALRYHVVKEHPTLGE